MNELDSDGNGGIDFPEFIVMLAREYNKKRIEHDIKNAFTAKELKAVKEVLEAINKSSDTNSLNINDLSKLFDLFKLEYCKNELSNTVN